MSSPQTPSRSILASIAAVAVFFLAHPNPVNAQTVQGRLMEVNTGVGIGSGWVMLLDTAFAVRASTVTNQDGGFRIQAPGPGSYLLLTEVLGYQPIIDGILDLQEGGSISIELHIRPKPLQMDSLVVAVERVQIFRHLERSGFNERMAGGFGFFITPEDLRRRNPIYYADLFRNTPGINLVGGGSMLGTQIEFANASVRGSTCRPPVFVDGSVVSTEFGGLESVVDINQIAAVEVYTRASNVPAEWGGTNSGCGVVLIWTR